MSQQCICDKIYKVAHRSCEPGNQYLCQQKQAATTPQFRLNGVEIDRNSAIANAVRILTDAKAPLITGLDHLGSRSISRAISVARRFRAAIDVSMDESAETSSLVREGSVSATLGELVSRTDRLLLIECDPMSTHPRLLQAILSSDKAIEIAFVKSSARSAPDLGQEHSFTLELDSQRLEYDLALLQAVIMKCQFHDQIPTLQLNAINKMNDWLRTGTFVSILTGALSESCCDTATAICKALNRDVKAVALHLRCDSNAIGAESSLAARTGFPRCVSFSSGFAKCFGNEFSTRNLLGRKEVDAVMTFDRRPLEFVPTNVPVIQFETPRADSAIQDRANEHQTLLKIDGLSNLDDDFCRVDHLSFRVEFSGEKTPQIAEFLTELAGTKNSTI